MPPNAAGEPPPVLAATVSDENHQQVLADGSMTLPKPPTRRDVVVDPTARAKTLLLPMGVSVGVWNGGVGGLRSGTPLQRPRLGRVKGSPADVLGAYRLLGHSGRGWGTGSHTAVECRPRTSRRR